MQKTLTLKSILVLAALSLSAGMASADERKQCFEDGLKNSWTAPAKNINLGHSDDNHNNNSDDRFEGGKGEKSSFEGGHHNFDDKDHGTGINVSPVSEPATDAMLLAGLVMVGTLVRRKSKATGSAFNANLAA